MNLDAITLIGAILTIAGLVGVGVVQIWATYQEAKLDDWEDAENGL